MKYVQRAVDRLKIGSGRFRIFRIFPGLALDDSDDKGFGPLGAFDHAYLDPGALVAMHEHQNDEIFSYLRKGAMLHKDSSGAQFPLTPTHLSVMNAGSGISHEESVPETQEPAELLQIFIRPREENLEPGIQHHEFQAAYSENAWRLLLGPEDSDAPLKARNRTWIYDTRISGKSLALPELNGLARLLYVFSGEAFLDDERFLEGDSILLVDEEELRRLRKDLPKFECHLVHDLERTIVFDDRYSVRWEVSQTDYSEPKRLGVRPGRWLEL